MCVSVCVCVGGRYVCYARIGTLLPPFALSFADLHSLQVSSPFCTPFHLTFTTISPNLSLSLSPSSNSPFQFPPSLPPVSTLPSSLLTTTPPLPFSQYSACGCNREWSLVFPSSLRLEVTGSKRHPDEWEPHLSSGSLRLWTLLAPSGVPLPWAEQDQGGVCVVCGVC